jgi:acyl carrier protein
MTQSDPSLRKPGSPERWATDARVDAILAVLAKETGVDRVKLQPGARIDDLGIASLDIVQSIFEIESKFDVEIPPVATTAGAEFATVGDLVCHVLATLDRQTDHAPGERARAIADSGPTV